MERLHPCPQVNSEKELMTPVTTDQKGQISQCKAEEMKSDVFLSGLPVLRWQS